MHANNHQDSTDTLSDLERDDAVECKSSEASWLPVTWLSPQRWQLLLHLRANENAFNRLPPREPPGSAGVPPASSPGVSLDESPGGETPPELAAVDGCATSCRFKVPMCGKKTVEAYDELSAQQASVEPPLIVRAEQCIEDHYSDDLSLEQVAGALRSDVSVFGPLFKQATGTDFYDYLAYVRVEKAKNLLLNPNYYITEIASELGFESPTHFNCAFIRIVGESPRAYCARLPASYPGAAQT